MLEIQFLFAAGEDLIKLVFILIGIIVWVISQLGSSSKKKARPEKPQGAGQKPPQPNKPRQGAGPQPDKDLRSEIEKFLNQVSGQEPPGKRPQPPPPQPAVDIVEAEVVAEEQPQSVAKRKADNVSAHVEEYLSTKRFDEHTSHLGYELGQSDERIEKRLHEKFDHSLSHLENTESIYQVSRDLSDGDKPLSGIASVDPSRLQAADINIAELLQDPANIRSAVILAEIFNRPENTKF